MTRSSDRSLPTVSGRNSGRTWPCTTPRPVSKWTRLRRRRWTRIGSPIRILSASTGPESGNRSIFPLAHYDDHYAVLLAEVVDELNPVRRDRSYPRVIKRKMSNFPVKRAHHRQRRQNSRPPCSAVVITPPSKSEYRKGPAKTT